VKRKKIPTSLGIVLTWSTFISTVIGVEMHYGTPNHYWNPLGAIVLGWVGALVMATFLALVSK
jgi:phosphate/sulfate permease